METTIDISKMDKAEVLAALYNGSHQQGMGFMHARGASGMTKEQAKEEINQRGANLYFDYLHGRVMKVNLNGASFDPWLYDRDNGQGAAARAIEPLQQSIAA